MTTECAYLVSDLESYVSIKHYIAKANDIQLRAEA